MNPNTQLVKPQTLQPARPSALSAMAKRINVEPDKLMAALQETCFKGANNEQMLALVVVSNEYGLNPFLKEIYAFPGKGGGIVPVISVDGWIKMVNRAETFDGLEFEWEWAEDGAPVSCTCTIFLKGRTRPVKVTEYFSECFRKTEPWQTMPRRMLRHKAMIQAARIAFGFSGVQDEDEALDVVSTVVTEPQRKLNNGPAQESEAKKETATVSPRVEFQKLMDEVGVDFSTVQKWLEETGNLPDASSLPSLNEVSEDLLKRLLRARTGLTSGLVAMKGAA